MQITIIEPPCPRIFLIPFQNLFVLTAVLLLLMLTDMKVHPEEPVPDADWLEDFEYTLNDTAGTITLSHYMGTRENLVIPGSVEIEGRQYQTVLYKNMFLGCDKTTIRTLCIASDVKFPDDSEGLFRGLSMMDTLTFGPDLDTSNVTNIEYLFDSCKSLKQLDLSMWDTGGVTSLNYLFRYCQCLEEVNLDGWDELEKEKQNENEESYQSSFKEDDVSGNQKDTDGDSSEEERKKRS